MLTTTEKSLSPSQLEQLEKFGRRVDKFGVNFAVCSSQGKLVLLCEGGGFKSDQKLIVENCLSAIKGSGECKKREGSQLSTIDNQILVTILNSGQDEPEFAALLDLSGISGVDSDRTHSEYLGQMLELLAEELQFTTKAEREIEIVSSELAQVYEELVLLHKLSTNMKVNTSDDNFLQMACDSLTEIVSVEGIAILLEKTVEDKKQLVLAAGSGLIEVDYYMADTLNCRLEEELKQGKEALLDSEVDSPFRYNWAENIKNIIVVPLFCKEKTSTDSEGTTQNSRGVIGIMVAINRIDKPDFDSTDIKLFNSVANGCAVFIENGRLFKDLKELFIGSLKALTNSIDAKDQYTHGHSERVAFISRWIAERLAEKTPLEDEQIHRIYLAGLLHDIGKVGIDEAVLRKKGRLTEEEFSRIRAHSAIGAGILSAIKQMQEIVPGVLSHHERIDGKGYPNGLVDKQISLIGKIVGLADSFDAMTSKRTYRDAMTVEQALAEIEKGLGTQFDEQIGRVFLDSDVYRLWDIIQDGFSETYGMSNFSEYGTIAVGTLIK
jgi:HD-GYP domain-containing protein (c-di-GMP phosphodiesterase class II)